MNDVNKRNKMVVVGLSGGVDSAVTAYLIKESGYKVQAVFMQNWDTADAACSAEQDLTDARMVCNTLNIPLKIVNFSKQYWGKIFEKCLNDFSAGLTPNPDVLCNQEIKFKCFLEYAIEQGADYIATGHYARIKRINDEYILQQAIDKHKDQSYFLYRLNQYQLSKSLFPLGEWCKPQVRQLAKDLNLPNHAKKDSTGICFIGERKFKDFLAEYIIKKPGLIKTTDGNIIGKHDGIMFYTLGQRKGLNIGGLKEYSNHSWYVVDKDIDENFLIVSQDSNHPSLNKRNLTSQNLNWISNKPPQHPYQCYASTRYNQEPQPCTITVVSENNCEVVFDQPQLAITPGQSVVLYNNEQCLGGGIIT